MKYRTLYAVLRIIPVAVLVVFFAVSSLIPALRPAYSETEKRELTEKPELEFNAMMTGEYFADYDLWFSDTFPFRELLIDGNLRLKRLYGLQTVYIEGNIEQGDEIPSVPPRTPGPSFTPIVPITPSPTPQETLTPSSDGSTPDATPEVTPTPTPALTPTPTPTDTQNPSAPTPSETNNVTPQQMGAVLLIGDSAYEYYSFNRANSEKYAAMVSDYATLLKGYASVYSVIIPNSMGIMPESDMLKGVNTSDQNQAINYIFSQMNDDVNKVYIYDTLKAHKNEYIYFRTDHHWTALGAYYAYQQLMAVKGIAPYALSSYQTMEFPGFLGTFYTKAGKPAAMENNPDTVIAYIPMGTNSIRFTAKDGSVSNWNIVRDVSGWKPNAKYNTFIGGDNPFSVIENPNVKNGQSCMIVKESYGNALVPFLVDHYEKVYVIDYRYYQGSLTEFIKTNHVTDLIFANNVIATRSEAAINYMNQLK